MCACEQSHKTHHKKHIMSSNMERTNTRKCTQIMAMQMITKENSMFIYVLCPNNEIKQETIMYVTNNKINYFIKTQ